MTACSWRGLAPALLQLLLLLTAAGRPAAAAAAAAASGRKLKQVTFFADTPEVATSTSLDGKGQLRLAPDGTVRAAGGASRSSTTALANSLLNTLGDFDNRPKAATSAYTQVPLALTFTQRPSLSYGLAEGDGDLAAGSDGQYAVGEFGYNPISNNLGLSASVGTSNALNLGQGDLNVPTQSKDYGFSGVEFVGTADDQTRLADARVSQLGQALAYPTNLVNPVNPLTCAQTLVTGWTMANYDLGAPGGPLPRGDPPALIPFCLQFFNFGTLDDFASFVDENFGPDNGPFTNDLPIINPPVDFTGSPSDGGGGGGTDGEDGGTEDAAGTARNGSSSRSSSSGGALPRLHAAAANGTSRPSPSSRSGGGSGSSSGGQKRPGGAVKVSDGDSVDQKKKNKQARAAAAAAAPMQALSDALQQILTSQSPAAAAVLYDSPLFQDLAARARDGPLGAVVNGTADVLGRAAVEGARELVDPVRNASQALSNLTGTVAANLSNLATDAAVHVIEANTPWIKLATQVQRNFTQPLKDLGSKLAARSASDLEAQLDGMPEGARKDAIKKSLDQQAADAAAAAAANVTAAAAAALPPPTAQGAPGQPQVPRQAAAAP